MSLLGILSVFLTKMHLEGSSSSAESSALIPISKVIVRDVNIRVFPSNCIPMTKPLKGKPSHPVKKKKME